MRLAGKLTLRELGKWFLIGIAISIGMMTVSLIFMGVMWAVQSNSSYSDNMDGLEITEQTVFRVESGIKIVGKIRNTSDAAKRNIDLKAIFYDDAGKVVDVYDDTVDATLNPDGETAFKIQCGSVKFPVQEHTEYEVTIVDASKVY